MRTRILSPLVPFVCAAAALFVIGGCDGSSGPTSSVPLNRVERDDRAMAPPVELLLQAYSAAFESGDRDALAAMLAPDFQYDIPRGCAVRADCGDTFPWDRAEELAWLGALIDRSDERHYNFYILSPEPTALAKHRWSAQVAMELSFRRTGGPSGGCYGSIDVEFRPDGRGGWLLTRILVRQYLRDDDGCSLVHFRCFN